MILTIDWNQLLLGNEGWSFLKETSLRTIIMFTVIVISLRLLGKRGVKQLSIFEMVVIIGLGSAAGDPMLYRDVGVVPAITAFVIIIVLYKIITFLVGKSKKFELLVEGSSVYLIKQGSFSIENFSKEALGEDEFFTELRMQGVSQLGQVESAIIESSGHISVFFYPDEEVKYGLPIMPDALKNTITGIEQKDQYSCTFCGYTKILEPASQHTCERCKKNEWVKASNRKRIR